MEKAILTALARAAEDLILVADGDGRCVTSSSSWSDFFGIRKSLEGRMIRELVDEVDRPEFDRFMKKLRTGDGEGKLLHRFCGAGGKKRLVESLGAGLAGPGRKHSHLVLISRDITERAQSENELRLLAQAVDGTRDAFCLTDLQDNILFVNPAFCETYGYTAEELAGKNIAALRSPSTPPEIAAGILPSTLAGSWNGELINRKKDGTEFPIELWTSVVRSDAGEPVACVGVARPIGKRKEAEERLKETANRLQLMLDHLSIVAFELDRDGIFLISRGKGLEKLGLKTDQVVGESVYEMYRDYPDIVRGVRNAIEGTQAHAEVMVGGVVWDANFIPVKSDGGHVERVFGTAVDITERKTAEDALRRDSHLWHTLMDNIPDTIYFKDLQSRFTRINRAQCTMLGVTDPADVLGKTEADFFQPEHAAQTFIDEREIMTTGRSILGKIEHVTTSDGKSRWFSTTKFPMRDEKGEVIGIVGSSREITELKQAEELEEALYSIAETTSAAVDMQELYAAIHAIIGRQMYAKNFYIALYDSAADILTFPYFVDEVDRPPSPREAGRGLTAYVLRTGASLLCDERMTEELARRGDAEVIGVPSPIWLGVPLVVDRRPIGAMVVQHYSDPNAFGQRELHILEFVSTQVAKAIEHKRAEEATRSSEEKYRRLFEESTDGIILSTPEGRIIDANPACVRLFGYDSPAEMIRGRSAEDFYVHPAERKIFKDRLEKDGFVTDFEVAVRRKDGTTLSVLESASAVRDPSGVTIMYRGFLRDITERKRLEEQLRQAQKMEGIGTLAGGIAHDFNNLLGIILGYASMLQDRNADPERVKKSVETIKKAVDRGAELVRQLLTFARKSEPAFVSMNVNETVSELARMLEQTFPRTISIKPVLGDRLPAIIADPAQIHQALLNLCVNSRDAIVGSTPGASEVGVLTLETGSLEGRALHGKFANATAAEYVFVRVGDTGEGMDEATKSRIFEPFFTTKERGKGTGLGLAVVYGVVNSHHALVDVQSRKGEGTSFTIYFPVPSRLVAQGEKEKELSAAAVEGKETILLIEDEAMLLDLLKGLLEDQGYRVLTAKDGQEGVEVFTANAGEIALVLSDMGLPRLGGWEMFQKMKERDPAVKAILASGYFDPNLKLDLVKAGAKDFIQKPYVAEVVLRRIREVIDEE